MLCCRNLWIFWSEPLAKRDGLGHKTLPTCSAWDTSLELFYRVVQHQMYSANDGFARLTIFHQMTIGFFKDKKPFYSKDREWLEDAVGFLLRGKFWDTRREVCIMYQTGNTPRFWKNKAWKWRKKGTKNYAFCSGAALEMGKQKKNLLHSIWQKYTNDTYWQKQSEKKRTFFYGSTNE